MEMSGPPPSNRLDFGACVVTLRRTEGQAVAPGELAATTNTVSQTLERELKPGSASSSSRGSWQEVGTDLLSAAEAAGTGFDKEDNSASSQPEQGKGDNCEQVQEGATAQPVLERKTQQLLLVHAGMDTEGNIFHDCLVTVIAS